MILAPEMTDFQQRVSELFGTNDHDRIAYFVEQLDDYGIDTEEQIDDAYYGCYPSESVFVEDLCDECYEDALDALPVWLQSAIDYELIWHQSLQYDFFKIYDRDSQEYYFFNRNF